MVEGTERTNAELDSHDRAISSLYIADVGKFSTTFYVLISSCIFIAYANLTAVHHLLTYNMANELFYSPLKIIEE